MTSYVWRGPLTSKAGAAMVPGLTVELDPNEPQVKTYLELGYVEAIPEKPTKTSKGDA